MVEVDSYGRWASWTEQALLFSVFSVYCWRMAPVMKDRLGHVSDNTFLIPRNKTLVTKG
jgi:hypothetical protein